MPKIDVDAVKARYRLSEIVGRDVVLKRSGGEFIGLCPFHAENTPSFHVNDAKGVYYCFGCNAGGDLISYICATEQTDFRQALRWLGADLPTPITASSPPTHAQERAERCAMQQEARAIWRRTLPIQGTLAEAYLRSRGIWTAPSSIGFARVPLWHDPATGRLGRWMPALVAAAEDVAGQVVGIQRICLTADGHKAGRQAKLSLGTVRGAALRLGPPAAHIMLCEGPEDGLTLRQRLPHASVWVALGTGNLASVMLPVQVQEVTIAGDNNAAGRAAAERAAGAYAYQGRQVSIVYPDPAFEDWNDELLGRCRA